MGRDAGNADFACVLPEHLQTTFSPNRSPARTINGPEHVAGGNARWRGPGVDREFNPVRHRCGPNAAVFADQITMHQRPSRWWTCANVSAATSDRRRPQPRRTARIAIAQAANRRNVRRAQERLRLPLRQPVSDANPRRFNALHAADPLRLQARAGRCPPLRLPAGGSPTFE